MNPIKPEFDDFVRWYLLTPPLWKRVLCMLISLVIYGEALRGSRADDDPYAALNALLKVTTKDIGDTSCSVGAALNFDDYPSRLALFRGAWLNKEYSIEFYNQRRKQVFLYVVAKRAAELLTEG